MLFASWLRTGKRHGTQSLRPSFRPSLETLGDRLVPSTLTVTNNLDSGPGSLRAEIAAARSGDTVNFAPSLDGETLTLTSGELAITKSLSIVGPGASQLTISGDDRFRVFDLVHKNSKTQVALSGLTISNGFGGFNDYGGGIYNAGGTTLTLSGCTLAGNSAGLGGGAIYNASKLTATNCTLSGNTASGGDGGGVYNQNGATLAISGSILSNDTAGNRGGAIFNASGMASVVNGCTLSGDYGFDGIAIYNQSLANAMTISSCTFFDSVEWYADIGGPFIDGGGNTNG